MQIYNGKSVFGGIAIGKISVYQKKEQQVKRVKIDDPEQEMARYEKAKAEGIKQLQGLYDKALREVGEANAAIFEVHQMMMEDDGYNESVENIIRSQGVNAEYAVATTGDNYAQMFSAMDDDYMRERVADVRDISERLLTILNGEETGAVDADEPKIIVAEDLAPSETVQLDKDKVLSFVTVKGSLNSHTAILARTMAIPALVNTSVSLESEMDGRLGIVDGADGTFYVDPDEETLAEMKKRQEEDLSRKQLLLTLKGKENVTLDGQKVMLYANIGNIKDLATVIQNDAGGIGLFRSEFIYLEKEDFPTEEEQFQIYRQVAQTMAGKRVIIRTLDIGADKQCDYFHMEHEENPALGCRAIRICLTRPEIFKTQLRALFRASAFGKIAIMYPMITSVQEVRKIKEIVEEVKAELTSQGVEFGNPEQGIMIETPAAAIISDDLAKEVDFFSIGTNDLSQYTMAIDRQNPQLDLFFDPHHPAVLRMISLVMENAHKAGIWAGICGELGADQSLTKEFLAMGVDELSVSPGSILPLRKIILETNVTDYKAGKEC
ncbi:phosphoenolpyruvate--protein phosphotransferase [Ruminococcus sp. 1001136sp1]|uniref:phosphoenolpyruvate--protein phosphotransferase n=1 Tax=unclassified Ruminococcus TaxID=2608920 RepID=UPI0018A0ED36|nr:MULTISPECIES: phosphoenolpyruvate--protein phosphotransferase [unclassified Ruminococcus]MDB8772465.1 phosphoenolpyruvate--protein phosphotransferase [Ruminococcus sp. 1001136sp1]MDB8784249.1 phosphoenolpyruvate--protein phosphotransferase [Ruminococcus sp. 1001136sp1]